MSNKRVAAVDCDLRKLYCVDSTGAVLAKAEENPFVLTELLIQGKYDAILFEVASSIIYRDGKGAAQNLNKWIIFNTMCATYMGTRIPNLLVSPSSVWPGKIELAVRHSVARCKQPQKDLREAESMIYFHGIAPDRWTNWLTYFQSV